MCIGRHCTLKVAVSIAALSSRVIILSCSGPLSPDVLELPFSILNLRVVMEVRRDIVRSTISVRRKVWRVSDLC